MLHLNLLKNVEVNKPASIENVEFLKDGVNTVAIPISQIAIFYSFFSFKSQTF